MRMRYPDDDTVALRAEAALLAADVHRNMLHAAQLHQLDRPERARELLSLARAQDDEAIRLYGLARQIEAGRMINRIFDETAKELTA